MCRLISIRLLFLLSCASMNPAQAGDPNYPGVGRSATAREIQAWNIDVRPDFKGLPKGTGTVLQGQQVWDAKCASCHGTFGELTQMSGPIVGGTTAEDSRTGRVAALSNPNTVLRSAIMKVPTLSTLWDYLYRAMPWNAPKSLSVDATYAVTAYILNLAEIVPEDFSLSDENIKTIQERMPNRNGMTRAHGLSTVKGTPDVANTDCMKDCSGKVTVHATIAEDALHSHGDLSLQNRRFGSVRGLPPGKNSVKRD
ncbi:Cytochrome c-like domain containing protein [Oxalobacteraceae bacterium]